MTRAYIIFFVLLFLGPVFVALAGHRLGSPDAGSWWAARRDSAGLAPDPAITEEPVVQVYAARAWGWRGALGVHTWVAVKPAGATGYTRYEVIGWGVQRGSPSVRVARGIPDAYWYGSKPQLLVELRGQGAGGVIREIDAAARAYPHGDSYRVWPGPNSNTFVAHVGREVPALRLDLPPTAVGKDYLPGGRLVGAAPSGTGYQISLLGLAGFMVAIEEGVEVSLLGLTIGLDLNPVALKLPGVGRLGFD